MTCVLTTWTYDSPADSLFASSGDKTTSTLLPGALWFVREKFGRALHLASQTQSLLLFFDAPLVGLTPYRFLNTMFTTCRLGSICKSRSMEIDPKRQTRSLRQSLVSLSTMFQRIRQQPTKYKKVVKLPLNVILIFCKPQIFFAC
jgi:hypothetical protein